MNVHCPFCLNPVPEAAAPGEHIVCPVCGSGFQLDTGQSTATFGPEGPRQIGRFELLAVLGAGAFGTVHKARDPNLDRVVALKVLRGGRLATEQERERFLREGRSVARLRHPGIVPVYDVGEDGGTPYLVSQYVPGLTLADYLTARKPGPHEIARIVATVADALHYAHEQGIVHRDVKPSNILLTEDYTPQLTDFGLAKLETGDVTVTLSGQVLGTPAYMSPEQARGDATVDRRSDVYSLGVVFYQLLTGETPFRGNVRMQLHQLLHDEPRRPRSLIDRLPLDLETICLKALSKEPARRYATAADLADDLRRYLEGRPIQARPASRLERAWRSCRRHPARAAIVALSFVALAAVSSFALSSGIAAENARDARRLQEQNDRTQTALSEAEKYRRESERLATRLALERGLTLCEQGDVGRGMLWLARSLEMAPPHATDLQHASRANLTGWRFLLHPLHRMLEHPREVIAVAFSPDGQKIVTGSQDRQARVWDMETGEQTLSLPHPGWARAVAFSPDGQRIVTGCQDGVARVWDAASGQELQRLEAHTALIRSIAFSHDGQRVLTGSDDGTTRLWETTTARQIHLLEPQGRRVTGVAFSPDDQTLASSSTDGAARLWDAATGELRTTLPHSGSIDSLAFSPDGATLATGGRDGVVRLWDTATGQPRDIRLQHRDYVSALAFSGDGKQLLTSSIDKTARLWDVSTGKAIGAPLWHRGGVRSAAFHPKGHCVVTVSEDRTARLWQLGVGLRPVTLPAALDAPAAPRAGAEMELPLGLGPFLDIVVSPDRKTGATVRRGGTIDLWEVGTGNRVGAPLKHGQDVLAMAFSPDGSTLATGTEDSIRRWEVATGSSLGPPLREGERVYCLTYSPDGKTLITSTAGGTAARASATGEPLYALAKDDLVNVVAFGPDGATFGTGHDSGSVQIWKTADGAHRHKLGPLPGEVHALLFSPDGRTVTAGSIDGSVRLWSTDSGAPRGQFSLPDPVWRLAFRPDSNVLLASSRSGFTRLWDVPAGRASGVPLQHQDLVATAAFSPDGKTVLTASWDKTARFWQLGTTLPLGPAFVHDSGVWSANYARKPHTVITLSADKMLRAWPALAPLDAQVERILFWVQVQTGLKLDPDGVIHVQSPADWQLCVKRLQDAGGPPLP